MKKTALVLFSVMASWQLGCEPALPPLIPGLTSAPVLNPQGETLGTTLVSGKVGETIPYQLIVEPRRHYTVCVAPDVGDADLYGSYQGVWSASKNRGMWIGQDLPMRDCLIFEVPQGDVIQLQLHAVQSFRGKLYFSSHPYDSVPPGFEKALIPPLAGPVTLTSPKWGPVGSPWGNDLPEFNPFADKDHDGYTHSGTDMYAPPGTPVRAMCTGTIHRNGMLDDLNPSEWGGYTILECTRGATTLAIAYDHIIPGSQPDVGTQVQQGQVIGQVYKMLAKGERDHLHSTICVGTYDQCAAVKQQPQRGSIHYTLFPGKWIESDPRKNEGLFVYNPPPTGQ